MILRCTCKESAAMMVAREDRPLNLAQRLTLRIHLMACDNCPIFERQMLTMRHALNQWRHYEESDESPIPPGA